MTMPRDRQRTAQVATDAEDLTQRYCVPLSSLTAPVEVGEIGCVQPNDPPLYSFISILVILALEPELTDELYTG